MSKCATPRCRGRTDSSHRSPYCSKCRARHWRENHPISYFYAKLRWRAKERGWDFSLTREQFEILWRQKGLNGGKTKFSLTFDRIDETKGYHFGNVRLLTNTLNARRRWVSFWKTKEDRDADIAEAEAAVRAAFPESQAT
jgi:hypothetical protein